MIVKIDAKHRVSIPAALAPTAPGDEFDAQFDPEHDVVTLRRIRRNQEWLSVWKQCPISMDDIPARCTELPKNAEL